MKKINLKALISLIMATFTLSCNTNIQKNETKPISTSESKDGSFKVIKTLQVGKTPHGIWQVGGFVYNSNIGEGTISVIDSKTDNIVKTIKLDDNGISGYIKGFHDNKYVLVTDTKNGLLLVIDISQEHKILQKIALGKTPDKILVSEDDKKVFVSLVGEDKIIELTFEIDRSKAPIKKEYKVGSMTEGSENRSIALTEGYLLASNLSDNDVSLINLTTNEEKRLKDGNNPSVVALGVIKDKPSIAIVGNYASNTITFFDLNSTNKKTLSDIGLTPTEIVTVPALNRAYVTMSGSNEVAVVDYNKQALVGKISVGNRPVHIYSVSLEDGLSVKHDGHEHKTPELWVGNDAGDSVSIIDSSTLEVKETVKVGKGHHKMAFTTDKAYISNINDNSITIIQRKK